MQDRDPATGPQVVIVGAGFGGLAAAKALSRAPVRLTVIDRQNHHCFQPLLYQVATAALTPAEVAWPIRGILHGQANARVLMAEVQGVDAAARRVRTDQGEFPYDLLVLATGATHAYFGHDDWAPFAPGLKRIADATDIRRRVLAAFERAELAEDAERRRALTTFVVIGGGPTGVEMAGSIAELAHKALAADFRNVDPSRARIVLVEAGPRLLSAFPEPLSGYARAVLERMGVEVITGSAVTDIDADGVCLGERRIEAGAMIWAAGVAASPAAEWLQAPADRAGRAQVGPDLSLPGHPEIFAIGDTAAVARPDGRPVPGIAPAAKQMGRYVGELIAARVQGRPAPGPFAYRHEGDLATIGRRAAIVKLKQLTLTGWLGWVFWGAAHIFFLIGVRDRLSVGLDWLWEYATLSRRSRLIVGPAGGDRD